MHVGLIGYPVRHSVSPVLQQAAFDALEIDASYALWETPADQLGGTVAMLRGPDYLGANVTIPHKQAVLKYLDEVDPMAAAIGAVNTIVRDGAGRLLGFNTDVEGFVRSIREDGASEIEGSRVVLLGSGGAARAVVAAALANRASDLTICARRAEQAKSLLADLTGHVLANAGTRTRVVPLGDPSAEAESAVRECKILVNATPVGMLRHGLHPSSSGEGPGVRPFPDEAPAGPDRILVQPEWLSVQMLVCDLVYNPPLTPLLEAARDRGARILNGLPMLVYQGAAAFELWTGRAAPVDLMRRKAREALHG